LPIIAVGLWSFVSVVIGGIYPTIIQKASVEPNELQKESRYIQRNINATRAAFGLDKVTEKNFDYQENLNGGAINANQGTIGDARLWDPNVLGQTYRELQQIRPQYTFGDVDIDRYNIEGKEHQVVLSARELDLTNLPSQTWQNRHLVYTHGYGMVMSPSNGINSDGSPEFLIKDIPPTSTVPSLDVTQPAIYFGEKLPGYAFVDTDQKEFDYPREPSDATTSYGGKGGVKVTNFLRRAALFLRFGDVKVLISSQITSKSKALYLRDVRDRVRKAAPFLKFDADPYPVLLNGRMIWVIDAYTVTDRYPYSEAYTPDPNRLTTASGLSTHLNYVRNSVKATVDSYDGTVKFYVYDDLTNPDPIIKAYRKAFPKLFTDRSKMPAGLVDHLRYPEDMFRVQTDRFADYHVTDPATFYQNTRQWAVAQDPGSGVLELSTQTTAAPAPGRPVPGPSKRARMDPYYLLMKLPGETKESFLILEPFVPVGAGGNELANLSGFMVAKSDPADYGRLESYSMPLGEVVRGPDQINAIINTTPDISSRLTLLNQQGSQIIQGNMLVIPVEQSLLYIRPLYIQGSGATKLPEFKFVVVVYGGKAVLGESLPDALAQLFPDLGPAPPPGGTAPPPTTPGGTAGVPNGNVSDLLAQAVSAYNDAQTALKGGDLAGYQKAVDHMADLIRQSQAVTPGGATTSTTAPAAGGGSGGGAANGATTTTAVRK